MDKKTAEKIYETVKKYDVIFIARHIGADPDALGSQLGLKKIINKAFPDKKVYAVGHYAAKFKYMGSLDKNDNLFKEDLEKSLLIVLDTPNIVRIDNVNISGFKEIIKIDHHPFMESFNGIEVIDENTSSTCEILLDLVNKSEFKLTKDAAENLFVGIVADTNRFMYQNSSPKTLKLVADLINEFNLDIVELYDKLYKRNYRELKFQSYIALNFEITKNKLAHITISDDILKEMNVDASVPGNIIGEYNNINDFLVWTIITEDKAQKVFKVSIRSRGPVINKIAEKHGGGGHPLASGIRLKEPSLIKNIIKDLDNECNKYLDNLQNK